MESTKKHFLILGSGCGGTSLVYSMMACSKELKMDFEYDNPCFTDYLRGMQDKINEAEKDGLIYGNKIPFEKVINAKQFWTTKDIFELAKLYKIIFVTRTFDRWAESWCSRQIPQDSKILYRWYCNYQDIILDLKALYPKDVLVVSYEDVIMHQEICLSLMSAFIGIKKPKLTGNVKHYDIDIKADNGRLKDLSKLTFSRTGVC